MPRGLTVVEPVPELIEAMLNQILGSPKVEPRVDWEGQLGSMTWHSLLRHSHSWMMLSKRMTENRRLDTAAAATVKRMTSRSTVRVD